MWSIIDADSIVYAAAGAAQYKDEKGELVYEPIAFAFANAKNIMLKIMERTGCHDYRAFLTESNDSNSFRKKLYPEYKANRKTPRPHYYHDVRKYLIDNWKVEVVNTIEADDAVSIMQWDVYKGEFKTEYNMPIMGLEEFNCPAVLCGIDKDLNQVPGLHYNYRKDNFYYITPIQGLRNFYLQILTGDRADNIPRVVKGWKQKEAESLIMNAKTEKELYTIVYNEIAKHRLPDYDKEHEINWKAQLLYLYKRQKDEYKISAFS